MIEEQLEHVHAFQRGKFLPSMYMWKKTISNQNLNINMLVNEVNQRIWKLETFEFEWK